MIFAATAGRKKANSVAVHFTLPLNWQIVSLESRTANDTFVVKDATRAVFSSGRICAGASSASVR
jgi:hypothetical protein